MADIVRIRLLGGFEASAGERVVPSGGWRLRKAKTLVKLLALHPAHTLHVEQAGDVLWPDRDVSAARNNLHQAVHAARRALATLGVDGPAVLSWRDDLLALGRDVAVTVDVDELRAAVDAAVADGNVERATSLLHDSPPELLPEDAYESWCRPHADAFREWRTHAVLEVADRQTEAGAPERAVVLLVPVCAADRLNEPAARALMRALSASGRRSDALVAYERLRAELRDQLGSDPEAETRTLFRHLLTGAPGRAPTGGGVPAQRGRESGNLPAPVSTVVGRTRELDEAVSILRRTRLLTLTGMGGVGKTTLAISLARRLSGNFRDGAYLVRLDAVRNGDQVVHQLARALSLALPPDHPPTDAVVAQLRSRHLLLVLDNCEHLLDACAEVVSALLRDCPELVLVATSREPLRVDGEVSWRTPSLSLPQANCTDRDELRRIPSVDLFVQRAAAALAGFDLTEENAAAVAAICHRLDGIPLALELAAACTPLLTPEEIAERLSDAIALLRRGDRSLTRQQTLEATLSWSHELLAADEQVLFRRLAVFAGSFDIVAVEAVCSEGLTVDVVVSALSRLVDTSLVVAEPRGAATRYRLLDTVRQYAVQRLRASREQADVERRHCEWCLRVATMTDPELHALVKVVPADLDVEHDNMRAALSWALSHDPPRALELALSLWRYWLARGFLAEGRRWLEAVLEAAPEASAARARAQLALAVFDIRRGRAERLLDLCSDAVAISRTGDDRRALAHALSAEATFAFLVGRWDVCWQHTVEARAAAGDALDLAAGAVQLQGVVRTAQGRLAEARDAFDEVRSMLSRAEATERPFFRPVSLGFAVDLAASGEPRVYFEETVFHGRIVAAQQADAHLLCNLADLARAAGDLDEALRFAGEAEEAFHAIDDVDGEAVALSRRGCLHRVRQEHSASRHALERALALRRVSGERRAVALARTNLGLLLAAEGDVAGGARTVLEEIERARDIQDAAAQAGMALTLASIRADAGEDEVAAFLLTPAVLPDQPLPGCHLAVAWGLVMRAAILGRLGRDGEAATAHTAAAQCFAALGVRGSRVVGRRRVRTGARR